MQRNITFLGDIAVPPGVLPTFGPQAIRDVLSGPVVANLEGAIVPDGRTLLSRNRMFNDRSVVQLFRELGVVGVSLANNHITDVERSPAYTAELLTKHGIISCGAGRDADEAAQPGRFELGGAEILLLGFGWPVIGCRSAGPERPGVNPLRPRHVIESVRRTRASNPDSVIVLLMHWNYELELYPQPMDRELAIAAVEAGANAIVGCHAHCVQGVEIINGAPVAYGLGNWFFPHGQFKAGQVRFPAIANRQLALEWDIDSGEIRCHWFDFDPDSNRIWHRSSETLQQSAAMKKLTPYADMPVADYVGWFRRHRRKKRMLPVYPSYRHVRCNRLRDGWVHLRQSGIAFLDRIGLKRART